MNEMESKLLLNIESKQVTVLPNNINLKSEDDERDCWASESCSSTGSYSSENESSIADWEAEINSSGELFYIESFSEYIKTSEKSLENETQFQPSQFVRRRSTRTGKFMRFIKRSGSTRYSTRNKGKNISLYCEQNSTANKTSSIKKFVRSKSFEVILTIDPEKRQNLGRRASKCEAYLGILPGISSDGTKIVVNGFVPEGEAIKTECIKEGDYLYRVNSTNVTFENLESVLSNLISPIDVVLEFQRITNVNESENFPNMHSPNQSPLVRQIVNQKKHVSYMENFINDSIGIMFLKATNHTRAEPQSQDILYIFPGLEGKIQETVLALTKGAFVTLNHMMTEILGSRLIRSTIYFQKKKIHISCITQDDNLLLVALSDVCCNEYEADKLTVDIIRVFEFIYGNLTQCFFLNKNHALLDHLLSLIGQHIQLQNFSDGISQDTINVSNFETSLPAAQLVQLPKDALIQIDAALNEMEAMDYRDWNEDPLNCQRLYSIIGSCLYHKSYLIRSHLPNENLIQVHSFLRQYGLLNLVKNEAVKSLIIWKKVYPSFITQEFVEITDTYTFIQNQWYLLVVGFKHDLLAVLLECGGCTAKIEEIVGPDVFYVEEAQETLKHIQKIGISTLASKWISTNARPEVINEQQTFVKSSSSIAENILGFIKPSETQNLSNKPNSSTKKVNEILSSKRHNSEDNIGTSESVYSFQTSDDSQSQGTGVVSEMSDEAAPILGRRAIREKINFALKYSEDSDSDSDLRKNEREISNMDLADIRESLLCEAKYISPKMLTVGKKNYLLHYLRLDLCDGVLISSTLDKCITKNSEIVLKFSRCAHITHKLFQNTLRSKKIPNQDVSKCAINKNLAAIREHGILFAWNNITYWVVGRLLLIPQVKEVYVCYQDSTPQNLVEMAFRLNFTN